MRTYTIGTGVLLGMLAATLTASAALAGSELLPVTTDPPEPAGEIYLTGDGSPYPAGDLYPPASPEVFTIGMAYPGGNIEVAVRCHGKISRLKSPVLEIGKLREVETPAGIPTYVAPATVKANTAPGDYPLTALCDCQTLHWLFTVDPAETGMQ